MKDIHNMRGLSVIVALMAGIFLITSGCSHKAANFSSQPPNLQESARILADYQPWFGSPGHIKIGYSTLDPAVLRKQIQKAKEMGIYAWRPASIRRSQLRTAAADIRRKQFPYLPDVRRDRGRQRPSYRQRAKRF
jgi:hypothetical protein